MATLSFAASTGLSDKADPGVQIARVGCIDVLQLGLICKQRQAAGITTGKAVD
jgi:hypothetical protein